MLNRDFWNSNTISLEQFLTLTSMKNLKWTPILFTPSEQYLVGVFLSKERDEWNAMRLRDCTVNLTANATDNFPQCAATHTRNMIRGKQGSFRKNLDIQKGCVYAVKRIVAMIERVLSKSSLAKVRTNGV